MASSNEYEAEVDGCDGDGVKVNDGGQTDQSSAEGFESGKQAPLTQQTGPRVLGDDGVNTREQNEWDVEEDTEDKSDGQIVGQK